MISIMVNEDTLIDALIARVMFWTDDEDVLELYKRYYEDGVYNGFYSNSEVDIMSIVDDDYVNWLSVYTEEEMQGEEWITDDRIVAEYGDLRLVDAR